MRRTVLVRRTVVDYETNWRTELLLWEVWMLRLMIAGYCLDGLAGAVRWVTRAL